MAASAWCWPPAPDHALVLSLSVVDTGGKQLEAVCVGCSGVGVALNAVNELPYTAHTSDLGAHHMHVSVVV